jgi:nucleotide-binding universal stress UspA family protein
VAVHALATDGPVLLGLDGSAGDDAAIEFAFDFAARHDAPLHALHGGHHGAGDALAQQYDTTLLAPWHGRYPKVAVTTEVLRDRPASALVSRSPAARLLVVGSHHHGTLHRVLTGSVSRTTLYHAACPVAVVPTGAAPAGRSPASYGVAASPTR